MVHHKINIVIIKIIIDQVLNQNKNLLIAYELLKMLLAQIETFRSEFI